jgi:predicted nucleic acid-binding protein
LGQICRDKGHAAGSLDLLIATLTIHHGAELITFDANYEPIALHSDLNLPLLTRPGLNPS